MSVRVVLWAAGVYGLTLVAMGAIGMGSSVPWSFVPALLLVHVPLAYPMARIPLAASTGAPRPLAAVGAVAAGLGLVLVPPLLPLWSKGLWIFVPFALVEIFRRRFGSFGDWARVLLVLFLGYASVWNLNYLAAAAAPALHDAAFLRMDRAIYAALLGRSETGPLFPVFPSPVATSTLQHAYTMLFSELFVVLGVLLVKSEDLDRFLVTTFAIYLLGIGTFLFLPVVGPHLAYYPEIFRSELLDTHPFGNVMRVWEREWRLARELHTKSGYGYFVGLPSLHVAMAVWLQVSLRISPLHFWLCLPVNLAMTASTFLLGYHWIADAAAGGLATWLVLVGRAWLERNRPARPPVPPLLRARS